MMGLMAGSAVLSVWRPPGLFSLSLGGVWWFFFFQAEDGIRDLTVTGVQTCALPICERPSDRAARARQAPCRVHLHSCKREVLMQVQGLVVHPPPAARRSSPSNASGILTLPGVARRFGASGRAPPLDDQARALLTTSTASQLREPRATTCRTAAPSLSVGMSVALITASARERSRATV